MAGSEFVETELLKSGGTMVLEPRRKEGKRC